MKINLKNILFALIVTPLVLSCDKFLDVKPSKTTSLVPETLEHLEDLLNGYENFYKEGNRTAVYSSDDYGLYKEMYQAKKTAYSIVAVEFAAWDIDIITSDAREDFWSNEYTKIFTANMILDYLTKMSGDSERKKVLEAEAHLIKAYSYWELANTYCLPYTEANKNELGLPVKNTVGFDESTARTNLETTYKAIETELSGALKLQEPLTMVNGKYRIWRGSKPAVNAFAARYYLFRNNYTEALKYAEAALTDHHELVDYNTDMRYSEKKLQLTINVGLPNQETVELKFPYTYDNQLDMTDMLEWKEFYYFRMLYNGDFWYKPSRELLALYDKDYDLRYRYHMVTNYSYMMGLTTPAYEWPGYIFFFRDRVPSGPTVAEMILTKAECQARLGQYGDAINTVNELRSKRMDSEAPENMIKLSATNQAEAIHKILEERRREMPFSMRWYDVRRFNNNDDPADDVTLTREFYPYNSASVEGSNPLKIYTLEKNSRRFAAPIHITEIQSSMGAIQQNKY